MKPMATYLSERPPHMHPEVVDYLVEKKRQEAIRKLGDRWRGRAHCSHRYTTSAGNPVLLP